MRFGVPDPTRFDYLRTPDMPVAMVGCCVLFCVLVKEEKGVGGGGVVPGGGGGGGGGGGACVWASMHGPLVLL